VSAPAPKNVRVRAYDVGFGDSFLLSFEYGKALEDGRSKRHMLIDFGSVRWPKPKHATYSEIADDIAEQTEEQLDVVVLTHRHRDHLGGYGDKKAAAKIAALKPRLVIRPWTEDPKLAADAKGPAGVGATSRRFAANLHEGQKFAEDIHRSLHGQRGFQGTLAAEAEHQIPNHDAIDALDALARNAALGGRYLYAGQESGIEEAIPGIGVKVLGPPTPDQWPEVTGERDDDPEFWIRRRGLLNHMLSEAKKGEPVQGRGIVDAGEKAPPGPARWLIERMRSQQTHSLMRLVETLEDAMNNTSVILLFEVGNRRLLFPGDAQVENWSYVLKSDKAGKLGDKLPDVDLYKVGHHGSRNATPRSLVKTWEEQKRKLTSVVSTLPDVFGKSEATAVPRITLMAALSKLGTLERTDELPSGSLYLELSGSTSDRTGYSVTSGNRP
jgi:L-ascorbate metabolism protein UlaG (beta-lactamase superfamily)